jgi:hypothetical protein
MQFVIETRKGYVSLPERIANYDFPLSFGSIQGATKFPSKMFGDRSMKHFRLDKGPYWGHVEEYENFEEKD